MSITRKKAIFKAMKCRTIKHTKFYSSEIKWIYSILIVLDTTKTKLPQSVPVIPESET